MSIELSSKVRALESYLSDMRHRLHELAELSGLEYKTQSFLISELESMGYKPYPIATGVVCDIAGTAKGKIRAIRCDTDALPIQDSSLCPARSADPNTMHACGHDGHMAMVLGLAKLCADNRPGRNLRLIFQYGEEGIGGAEFMINKGVLKDVQDIFAVHMCPELDIGTIASTSGAMFAGAVEFLIDIAGISSHCSDPSKGKDALAAAAQIYKALQSANDTRKHNTLLFCGALSAGTAANVVPDSAKLKCTLRYFNPDDVDIVMMNIAKALVDSDNTFGTTHRLTVSANYPPLINTPAGFEVLSGVVSVNGCEPRYTAEDFAFYVSAVDGAMAWLGCRSNDREYYPLHSDKFDFDNHALTYGLELFWRLANG